MMSSSTPRPVTKAPQAIRGAIAVEFALILIPMLLIFGGIVEFGRVMWHANVLTKATRDGARVLSAWDPADLASGIDTSVERVVATANFSRLSPALTATEISVMCDYSTGSTPAFDFVPCSVSTAPVSVRVGIVGYQFNLGEWMPFIGRDGLIELGAVVLAPHTTMPYLRDAP